MIKMILKEFPMILPLLACLTLVGASSAPLVVSSLPFGNEPLPQCVVYDDESYTITLDVDEVNNYTFQNAYDSLRTYYIQEDDATIIGTISVNSLSFDGFYVTDSLFGWYPQDSEGVEITFGTSSYKFELSVNSDSSSFNTSFVWVLNSITYSGVKSAIETDISANGLGMSGVEVVNEIVDILAGGLTSLGSSLGGAIATFAQSLAFQDGELSVYFVLIVVFASVSLAIGLTTLLFNWLTNLGR